MAPIFNRVSELNPTKTQWALKLRVVRVYENPLHGDRNEIYSLEAVCHDAHMDRVHCSVKKTLINHFKPLLKEGHLYLIRDFIVASNDMTFKTTPHKYKVNFLSKTKVTEINDEHFPTRMYEFKPFTNILESSESNETTLFDVIGEVVARDSTKTRNSSTLLDLIIEDTEKNRVPVTLWGGFADEVGSYLDKSNSEPVIVVLQMFRSKTFKGVVRVSNIYHVSKVLVNAPIDDIREFRNRLLVGEDSQPNRISQLSSPSVYSVSNDLASSISELKNIEQLMESDEVGSFWVYATVVAVENEQDWCYLSCKKCPKKLSHVGARFYCERCDRYEISGNSRFKLQVRVIDRSGNTSFLLWDRESTELIGRSASDLMSDMGEKSQDSLLPPELELLADRKALFKVQVKTDNISNRCKVYTVMRLTTDENLIAKYANFFDPGRQESDIFSKLGSVDVEDEKVSSSNDEISSPMKTTPNLTILRNAAENNSAKRSLLGDFSSTATPKKCRVAVKKEQE